MIAAFAEEKSVGDGHVLLREGDYANEFMIIEEGSAVVERGGEQIAELGPGDFFGETAVINKDMRSATVRATAPVLLISLTTFDFKRMERLPGVMAKIEETVEARSAG